MGGNHRIPAIPRLAATVLVVRDDPFEVLMMERNSGMLFASALVFPGGTVDSDDFSEDWLPLIDDAANLELEERALKIAAARETFEEAGILLAESGAFAPDIPRTLPFIEVVRIAGVRLGLGGLRKIGHWIAPEVAARRFDTHFYVAGVPADTIPMCDGGESVALEWMAPARALELAEAGERNIIFPTRMNLKRLAESHSVAEAFEAALRPVFTVRPVVEATRDGHVVRIPAEAGYGTTCDRPHPDVVR